MSNMKIFLASKNQDKISEIKKILSRNSIDLLTCYDIDIPDVEENGSTFVENALLKAKSASKTTGLASIADDSGIEVDYLNGRPGVISARYSGTDATNEKNNLKLLEELDGVPFEKRKACYRCVIVFMRFPEDPFPFISSGSWTGYIADKPKGSNGFGYDPIFYLSDYKKTSAEISPNEKNKISHRSIALRKFEEFIGNII
ncbi:MAG: non-canonical purine NTP pyrophosphatase, RdgB/HAM1 family [Gammaproteobacteria bacterium]|nr:non-canonical purine NTP pyrophosphatase, RdgB/HAM1 family [Gammaproteobacteria bacterium]